MTCNYYCGMGRDIDAEKKNQQINFYKLLFINVISGLEIFNEKYDPYGLNLKDWSKTIASNIEDYRPIFEKLYEKYKDRAIVELQPEVQLYIWTIMSALGQHISNHLFRNNNTTNFMPNTRMPTTNPFCRSSYY